METSGIDAFAQVLSNSGNWVVPPPILILKVVRQIKQEKCKCTLLIPKWKSAPFWPLLVNKEGSFKWYVTSKSKF